jgi:hypothetical protein
VVNCLCSVVSGQLSGVQLSVSSVVFSSAVRVHLSVFSCRWSAVRVQLSAVQSTSLRFGLPYLISHLLYFYHAWMGKTQEASSTCVISSHNFPETYSAVPGVSSLPCNQALQQSPGHYAVLDAKVITYVPDHRLRPDNNFATSSITSRGKIFGKSTSRVRLEF